MLATSKKTGDCSVEKESRSLHYISCKEGYEISISVGIKNFIKKLCQSVIYYTTHKVMNHTDLHLLETVKD